MVNAWGGYANGQIPLSAMKSIQGQYFESEMYNRMVELINQCAAQGVNVRINEGYRSLGQPSDRYVRNESQTSTGGSNQYFQLGRMDRGETPSAGTPGTSSHGWGMAADIYPGRNNAVVANVCASLGLVFTVASESWHIAMNGAGSASNVNGSEIQSLLNNFGYGLVVDGIVGNKTMAAIKDFQASRGLVVDGIVGPRTMAALKTGNTPFGALAVDGDFGKNTIKALQRALGVSDDGSFGPTSTVALQAFLGITQDGSWGSATTSALQAYLGVTVDGSFGPQSVRAMQERLNAGQFTKPAPTPPVTPTPKPEVPVTPPKPPVEPVQEKPNPTPTPAPEKPVVVKPTKPTKPVKEPTMSEVKPLPEESNTAASDALGILIPQAKNRKLAYAIYGLGALVVSNLAVATMAAGIQAPVWLIVASAVVGNLAVPFTTLAIANAGTTKK